MNGVYETTTTSGTGTLTLTAVTGRPRFADACLTGELVPYAIKDGNSWEWGMGTVAASNTLERSIVKATYASGVYDDTSPAALTLSGSAADVWLSAIAGASVPGFPMVSSVFGRKGYHSPHWGGIPTGTQAVTADRLYISPIRVDTALTIDGFYIDMNTAGAASTKARIGIYRIKSDGQPGAVICETADIDTSVSAAVLSSSVTAITIKPGWYYLGLLCSGTPTFTAWPSTTPSVSPLGISSAASECLPIQFLYKAITAGWTALPADPTGLSVITVNIAAHPAIALKVA